MRGQEPPSFETEEEVREWVSRKRKRPVPDELWSLLTEKPDFDLVGDVLHACDAGERVECLRALLNAAQRFEGYHRLMLGKKIPIGRAVIEEDPASLVQLSEYENLRTSVLSEHLAKSAEFEQEVQSFRRRALGGRFLSADEAHAFLKTEAFRYVPLEQFEYLRLPLIGITTAVETRQVDGELEYHCSLTHGEATITYSRIVGHDDTPSLVAAPDDKMRSTFRIPVMKWSVLDSVRLLAEMLVHRYKWQDAQAVWWLLTGAIPVVMPIRTRLSHYGTPEHSGTWIKLEIQSWIPAFTVLEVYRRLQRETLTGHDNRPISAKTLTLVRFVTDHRDADGNLLPWREFMALWNREQPDGWRFADHRNFRRAVLEAVRLVCYSGS